MKSNEERVKSILKKASEYKMKRRKEGYTLVTCICAVTVAIVVGLNITPLSNNIKSDNEESIFNVYQTNEKELAFNNLNEIKLTTFKTKKELVDKLKNGKNYNLYRYGDLKLNNSIGMPEAAVGDSAVKDYSATQGAEAEKSKYSETNTQVQGIDESDIVKTNGEYIYYLSNNKLRIFENKEELKLVKEISFNKKENEYIYAGELYLSDDYIIVIASGNILNPYKKNNVETYNNVYFGTMIDCITPYRYGNNSTKILIYDINNYELVREIETEGNYVSSRKIEDDIYFISNKYIDMYYFDENEVLPLYRDSLATSGEVNEVPVSSIKCFPNFEDEVECTYMIITSFNLNELDKKANVETFIGTGNEIYCSKDNLYVTSSKYEYKNSENITETLIRKFAIYGGKIKYVAEGKVDGILLNQFSMDEYDGNFRITTTKGNTWDDSSENNLYVLDDKLNIIGKLEGLAKGEKIYSTRFMGDKCYVVTYKTVDPLFVLDLSNPENPTVLRRVENSRL